MSISSAAMLCAARLFVDTHKSMVTHARAAALRACVMLRTLIYATLVKAALSLSCPAPPSASQCRRT